MICGLRTSFTRTKTNRPLVLEQRGKLKLGSPTKARAARKRGRLASSSDEEEIGSDASSCSDDEDNPTDVTEAARVMGEDWFKKYNCNELRDMCAARSLIRRGRRA